MKTISDWPVDTYGNPVVNPNGFPKRPFTLTPQAVQANCSALVLNYIYFYTVILAFDSSTLYLTLAGEVMPIRRLYLQCVRTAGTFSATFNGITYFSSGSTSIMSIDVPQTMIPNGVNGLSIVTTGFSGTLVISLVT
jgi:hypothetical protein